MFGNEGVGFKTQLKEEKDTYGGRGVDIVLRKTYIESLISY